MNIHPFFNLVSVPSWTNVYRFYRSPLQFLAAASRGHPNFVEFALGTRRVVLLLNPEYIAYPFVKHRSKYKKEARLRVVLGDGLTNSEGELWDDQRALISKNLTMYEVVKIGSLVTRMTDGLDEALAEVALALHPGHAPFPPRDGSVRLDCPSHPRKRGERRSGGRRPR